MTISLELNEFLKENTTPVQSSRDENDSVRSCRALAVARMQPTGDFTLFQPWHHPSLLDLCPPYQRHMRPSPLLPFLGAGADRHASTDAPPASLEQ
jgi:hypothetical protein